MQNQHLVWQVRILEQTEGKDSRRKGEKKKEEDEAKIEKADLLSKQE